MGTIETIIENENGEGKEIVIKYQMSSEQSGYGARAFNKPIQVPNPDYVNNTIVDEDGNTISDPANLPEMIDNPQSDEDFVIEKMVTLIGTAVIQKLNDRISKQVLKENPPSDILNRVIIN